MKKAARNSVHSKITKYFRSLYFLLISTANSIFPGRLSATFEVIISFIFAASVAFRSAGNSIAICFVFTKMEGNRITNILILKMAIANLLVTISVMPFSVLVHNVGSRSIGGRFGEISHKFVHSVYIRCPHELRFLLSY